MFPCDADAEHLSPLLDLRLLTCVPKISEPDTDQAQLGQRGNGWGVKFLRVGLALG